MRMFALLYIPNGKVSAPGMVFSKSDVIFIVNVLYIGRKTTNVIHPNIL